MTTQHIVIHQKNKFPLVVGVALMLCACSPTPLSQHMVQFYASLDKAPVEARIPLSTLQQLDPSLLRPASLYPQLTAFSLTALSRLYQYHQHCSGPLDGIPKDFRQFEKAWCSQASLPSAWFHTHPIYPLGGSTAWYYLQRHPEAVSRLQDMLHLRERPQALDGIGQLSDDNLNALADGQRWLLQKDALWRQQQHHWVRYSPQIWQPLAKQAGIELVPMGERCDIALGTLCANPLNNGLQVWHWLLAMVALISGLALSWAGWQRQRLRRRQRFIVQMLTHELRTPIAQLSNVVEHFRRDFDALPPNAQIGFGSLADSVQRIRQMAEASQHYLSAENQRDLLEIPTTVRLSEWLAHIAEPYAGLFFCLDKDRQVRLPLYWISLCLNNLLDNAYRHGRAPVQLTIDGHKGRLTVQITDTGSLLVDHRSQEHRVLSPQAGMGLGLTIVRHVIQRLNGRLTIRKQPTTFILELPCDIQE